MPNYAPQISDDTPNTPTVSCPTTPDTDGKYVFLTSLVILSALVIVIFAIYAIRR
ncbi:hypothetical protein KAW18_11635 [candidate division WOR-3 bacterium]|nr:hypothetical protein [candidate division WOR-3 bacterium]